MKVLDEFANYPMTKREEIREGIAKLVHHWHIGGSERWEDNDEEHWQGPMRWQYYEAADKLIPYLHSQGVVIRGSSIGASHPHLVNYFTVEPLI